MPQQVLPSVESYEEFREKMEGMHFRSLSDVEFRKNFIRLGLRPPRFQPVGREEGFIFYANELVVCVWTTWVNAVQQARESDAGWVLILKKDGLKYVARPLHRTKNFLTKLLQLAWIARYRVINRPLCPECKAYMEITRGQAMKARYWRCNNRQLHESKKSVCLDWDFGLPSRAKKIVTTYRRERARYRAKRKAENQPNFVAIKIRKPWGHGTGSG